MNVLAQVSPGELARFIGQESKMQLLSLKHPQEIKAFYANLNFHAVWNNSAGLAGELAGLMDQAPSYGLDKNDYNPVFRWISELDSLSGDDLIRAELGLTDAALHFLHDLAYGNKPQAVGYNGFNYSPSCLDLVAVLLRRIESGRLGDLPAAVEPGITGYAATREKIRGCQARLSDPGFREIKITSTKVSISNKALVGKLFQLGLLDSGVHLTDSVLRTRVKAAQKQFNLLADGVLRSTSLEAFNVPLAARLKELETAINSLRWLACAQRSGRLAVVNIPSATLLVFGEDSVVMESRVIVGKRSTPTPTLVSEINEVILYPYWMVPHSIATKELLPSIRRDIGYLEANGYQVINRQGRIVDPYKVDWSVLSGSNFPYIIRQSTGCDNALGLIKLNFYNPYSVYLHDTPNKGLFGFNKRYFSHGCMRLEKAFELGRLVLTGNNTAIDTLTEKGCLYNQSPIVVPATQKIPVFVLNNTAWVDSVGRVSLSEDVYGKNSALFAELR
jgi:murein L,D-transpeptidase YcbB/YkuD